MTDLNGLQVAITGGARGIGRAIAEQLAGAGAKVAIGDLDLAITQATADELGHGVAALRVDVSEPESFAAFLDSAANALGGLSVLINNAGIMPIGPFLAESDDLTRRTIEVDLMGVISGTRLAGAKFVAQGSGHIVNIASVLGTLTSPNAATYCATKYAVVGLSEALRQEWHDTGVKVTAICPGFVRTELIAGMSAPGALEKYMMVDPEQVAAAVVKEIRSGKSDTVYVPRLAGTLSRWSRLMPSGVRDWVFRASGGNKVTENLDQDARAAYQARIEGKESA